LLIELALNLKSFNWLNS